MHAPLEGIRVLDLTRILAGPFATMILGDLGAEVIKVERPGRGDETRHWGPPFEDGVATYYLSVNRNKRSLTLELGSPRGRQLLWQLLEEADVLVSNFRPGVLSGLGFSWDEIRGRCRRLVCARLNGFGEEGAQSDRPAFDLVIQAEAGLMDLTGEAQGPPTKAGLSLADEIAGLYLVQGVLAALVRRQRTGEGELVEVALHDAMLSMLTYHAQAYLSAGLVPRRMGNAHPNLVPYRPFPTSDGHIVVGVASERQWRRFCAAVELPALPEDARFASNADRVRHREELEALLRQRLSQEDTDTWRRRLEAAEVPCGTVRTAVEALDSADRERRGMIVHMPDGGLPMLGLPVRLEGTPVLRRSPPGLGEHTVQILEELGYTASEVAQLRAQGVV